MAPQQYVGLFVRLFAIWLLFLAVQTVGMGVALDESGAAHGRTLGTYVIAAILMIAGVTLFRFPMAVANKLVPESTLDPSFPVSPGDLATVACIILGLWLCVAQALPLLIRYSSVVLVLLREDIPLSSLGTKNWTLLVQGLIELAIALILVLRARNISRYLLLPRTGGGASRGDL